MLLFLVVLALLFALFGLMVVSGWKVFEKAGQPGWASLVPVYNVYVFATEIAGKEMLWFLLCLVPIVNILVCIEAAKRFGQSAIFGVGLALLPFVFWPMLAFGDAEYASAQRGRRSRGRGYDSYEEEDEYDRPTKKRRSYEEDEDEVEDRPSKRRQVADEGDRPAKKRRPYEDDADDRPAKKRPVDDEGDFNDRPSKRRRNRDDDEDARPARRRRDD